MQSFHLKKKYLVFFLIAVVVIAAVVIGVTYMGNENAEQKISDGGNTVVLVTSLGDITIELYEDMPITTGNFKKLVKEGFYDGVIFHRVIDGFMIQGGDPAGTGRGGPGYMIKDEFFGEQKNNRGTISMANAGPNTGGSQFFINLINNNFLDGRHPVFGKVTSGMDIVDKIAKVRTDDQDRPIEKVTILRVRM